MTNNKVLKLFDNMTRAQISWNLMIYKELSATYLTKLIEKNISTITRNLEAMQEADLVYISRTEIKKNFLEKYWKLNTNIFPGEIMLHEESIGLLHKADQERVLEQLENLMILAQGIIWSILDQKIRNRGNQTNLMMLLLDKELANVLKEKLEKFIKTFLEENGSRVSTDLKEIKEDSDIFFFISSHIKKLMRSF